MATLPEIKDSIAQQWITLTRIADEYNCSISEMVRELAELEKAAEREPRAFGRNLGVRRFPLTISLAARRVALVNLRAALAFPPKRMCASTAASMPRRRLLAQALAEDLRKQLKATGIGYGLGDSELVGGKIAA